MKNLKIMQNFTIKNIPNLDVCVLGALEFFMQNKPCQINIKKYKKPLVVGSGNANVIGKILFKNHDAVFADESNYELKLKSIKSIDSVIIISASGKKHAVVIAKTSKKYKKKVILLTNNKNALAKKFANKVYFCEKQREPYTYNTSTYMNFILKDSNHAKKIYNFINKKIKKIKLTDFKKYKKYYIIVPPEFREITRMIQIKFIELFGREIARDIESFEYVKHATTIIPSNELFISFGINNKIYGKNRLNIPLPKNTEYAGIMAISYYIIGKIQEKYPNYFKKNILNYTKKASKLFNQEIKVIVE
jgi:hypothetical protein